MEMWSSGAWLSGALAVLAWPCLDWRSCRGLFQRTPFCGPPGDAWRLEDDCAEPPSAPRLGTAVEDAPFSYFRTRSFYMRKSLSVDNHLGALSYAVHPAETKAERVRTKLRRQFVSTWRRAPRAAPATHPFPAASLPGSASMGCPSPLEEGAGSSPTLPHPACPGRVSSRCPWLVSGSQVAVAQGGDACSEVELPECCCPKCDSRLEGGTEFSCPLPHLQKQLGPLEMGAARGWGET